MLDFKHIGQKERMEHIDRLEQMEHMEGIEKANTGERIDNMEVKNIVEKVDNMKQRWELFKLKKHKWNHFFNRKKRFASDETLPDIVDAKTKKQLG